MNAKPRALEKATSIDAESTCNPSVTTVPHYLVTCLTKRQHSYYGATCWATGADPKDLQWSSRINLTEASFLSNLLSSRGNLVNYSGCSGLYPDEQVGTYPE